MDAQAGRGRRGNVECLTVDARQLSALLGVCVRVAHQWNTSGKLGPSPVIRQGRVVRWLRREVELWLEAGAPPRAKWQVIRAKTLADARGSADAAELLKAIELLVADHLCGPRASLLQSSA